jgi:hypothetical protein
MALLLSMTSAAASTLSAAPVAKPEPARGELRRHAAELVAEDRGVLAAFADAPAMARGILGLLRDDTRRNSMRKTAYKRDAK